MHEHIKKRRDFKDIDIDEIGRIPYVPYYEAPRCTDYKYGERRRIILRNALTGELEEICYQLISAVPYEVCPGYYWYWGKIDANDLNCYLVFYFESDGSLRSISASFSGSGPTKDDHKRMVEAAPYAAAYTAMGPFGSHQWA